MTALHKAAQQAVQAMLNFPGDISDEMFESIMTLKAALAAPAQEPVAVVALDTSQPFVAMCYDGQVTKWEQISEHKTVMMFKDLPLNTLLYASPTQRKPLTNEEIYAIWEKAATQDNGHHARLDNQPFVHFARAIEQAHGIKE